MHSDYNLSGGHGKPDEIFDRILLRNLPLWVRQQVHSGKGTLTRVRRLSPQLSLMVLSQYRGGLYLRNRQYQFDMCRVMDQLLLDSLECDTNSRYILPAGRLIKP